MASRQPCIPRIQVDRLDDRSGPNRRSISCALRSAGSSSLPNLAEPQLAGTNNNQLAAETNGGACGSSHDSKHQKSCRHGEGDKLCIYCSPRGPRRQLFLQRPSSTGSHRRDAGSPLQRSFRLGNDSDSDSSVRSASHISTCASVDFRNSTFSSRMSLIDNGYESYGSLRRIYSNPETPLDCLSPSSDGPAIKDCTCSRSCSNLRAGFSEQVPAKKTILSASELSPGVIRTALDTVRDLEGGVNSDVYINGDGGDTDVNHPPESRNVRVLRWLEGLDSTSNGTNTNNSPTRP